MLHITMWETLGSSDSLYIFVLEGDISVDENKQNRRDTIAITGTDNVTIHADSEAKVLIMEVPYK